jgi:hypothetical protein
VEELLDERQRVSLADLIHATCQVIVVAGISVSGLVSGVLMEVADSSSFMSTLSMTIACSGAPSNLAASSVIIRQRNAHTIMHFGAV